MLVKKRQVVTYDFEGIFDGYCIDVETKIDRNDMLEFYIYHKQYNIKKYMFGVFKKTLKKENLSVEDIISGNIEQHIKSYKKLIEE